MNTMECRSSKAGPETGLKFEAWRKALHGSHDGTWDEESLFNSRFGQELVRTNELRFRFEEDTMGDEVLSFYRELGVRKEFFTGPDFYDRWMLFTPLEAEKNPAAQTKYPIVFWNHGGGNAIETDEFSVHFSQMVGKEKFILVMLQDTRWERVNEKIDKVASLYPADLERVYVAGYSQGGQAAHSALLRIPQRLAAAAPCGAEIFQQWDHLDVRYTVPELLNLRHHFVPTMEMTGVCEFLTFLPVNHYRPICMNPPEEGAAITTYNVPGHDRDKDPTNPPGKRADKPFPPAGSDEEAADRWKLSRLNLRMFVQHCAPRDENICLGYRNTPDDVLHHKLGFYGDEETIKMIGGVPHYIADIKNSDGILAFRYCGIDNFPHWPSPYLAELTWDFLRRYRRDSKTGRIVEDPYRP